MTPKYNRVCVPAFRESEKDNRALHGFSEWQEYGWYFKKYKSVNGHPGTGSVRFSFVFSSFFGIFYAPLSFFVRFSFVLLSHALVRSFFVRLSSKGRSFVRFSFGVKIKRTPPTVDVLLHKDITVSARLNRSAGTRGSATEPTEVGTKTQAENGVGRHRRRRRYSRYKSCLGSMCNSYLD